MNDISFSEFFPTTAMLWWDDNPAKLRSSRNNPPNGSDLENCYRNTGTVPVPRKISKNSQPSRKISAPGPPPVKTPAVVSRKVSCPVIPSQKPVQRPKLKLMQAILDELKVEEEQSSDFSPSDNRTSETKVKSSIVKASSAGLFVKVTNKPKLIIAAEKAVTTEAEVKKELKRGSMRDKWGLSLTYNIDGARITLSVSKVSMFSPAAKAGLTVGDTIVTINDWNVEAMENIQAVLNIFLAAGFSVVLGWSRSAGGQADQAWLSLDPI